MSRAPAECFPVGAFLAEEMEARGWTAADVAARMPDSASRDVWELTVELLVHASDMPGIVIGESTANGLAAAFGVSPEFFVNLNNSYQAWLAAKVKNVARND